MNIESLKGPQSEHQYVNLNFHNKGGMGEIYSADDSVNNTKVAIKIIVVDNPAEKELLKSEFQIAEGLSHPNIIRTYYSGEYEEKKVTYFYSVMEYVNNGNLRDLLSRRKEFLPIDDCIKFMKDLSAAIKYAHDTIIHRDLKPENILIDDGVLKVCDFGLAKLVDSHTRSHSFKGVGTLPYMAPECWTFDTNTILMDVYSLGLIFFEILTLKRVYNARSYDEYKEMHLFESLPNISDLRVDIPVRLIEMISKMSQKRPQNRYQNIDQVIQIIEDIENVATIDKKSQHEDLLKKAHDKLEQETQKDLEQQKLLEERETYRRFLAYSKEQLFKEISDKIDQVNKSLEQEKIRYNIREDGMDGSFLSKYFTVTFYPESDIERVLTKNKEFFFRNQEKKYDAIFQEYQEPQLVKDNVVLIGKVTVSSDPIWGFNVVLRKVSTDDLYGEWWVVWFNDSPLSNVQSPKNHYPIDIPDFYREYEFGRGRVIHSRTMGIGNFGEKIIHELLAKLFE